MADESRAYNVLKKTFPQAHWLRIESWTMTGIFDLNGCLQGVESWVELKDMEVPKTNRGLYRTKVRPAQVAWEFLRRRAGGRTFVAAMVEDDLYLLPGYLLRELKKGVTLSWLKNQRRNIRELFDR